MRAFSFCTSAGAWQQAAVVQEVDAGLRTPEDTHPDPQRALQVCSPLPWPFACNLGA